MLRGNLYIYFLLKRSEVNISYRTLPPDVIEIQCFDEGHFIGADACFLFSQLILCFIRCMGFEYVAQLHIKC